MSNVKSVFASKINWFVVITTFGDILALTEFKNVVPAGWMPYIILGQGVVGIVLRNFFSGQPTTQFAANRYQCR